MTFGGGNASEADRVLSWTVRVLSRGEGPFVEFGVTI